MAEYGGRLVSIELWLVIALGMATVAWSFGRHRVGGALTLSVFIFMCLGGIFPIGDVVLKPLEKTYPAFPALESVDGVIVLGGSEESSVSEYWGHGQFNGAGERLTAALLLLHKHPEAKVIVSGKCGGRRCAPKDSYTEAMIASQFLEQHGISPARHRREVHATNTRENAQRVTEKFKPQKGETWVLVTSAYHMPRALKRFQQAGWTGLVPYPVDYRTAGFYDHIGWNLLGNLHKVNLALKEYLWRVINFIA